MKVEEVISYQVVCASDDCEEGSSIAGSPEMARVYAREDGYKTIDGDTFCQTCAENSELRKVRRG